MKKLNFTVEDQKTELPKVNYNPLSCVFLNEEERDLSKNIYLDSVSSPFFDYSELKKFDKTIEELTSREIEVDKPDYFLRLISYNVTSLIKDLIRNDYCYIKNILLFSKDKNIVGSLLTFNVSCNKYELNISDLNRIINNIILIFKMTTTFYDVLDKNRKQKQPRLKKNDISLIAYQLTIKLYLSDNTISVRKACFIIYEYINSKGYTKIFSEFDSYKQAFLDWCNNVQNQYKYPEIKVFLVEKDKRIALKKTKKNM